MKILFANLSQYAIQKIIICSIDQALYQVMVVIDGEERLVWKTEKVRLCSRNLMELREKLMHLAVPALYLLHESAYDEMIGLQANQYGNRLEVPLGKDPYAKPEWLN